MFSKSMYRMKQVRDYLVKFDVEKEVIIEGRKVIRRSFLILDEHIGMKGPSIKIIHQDIGNVFVIDEQPDGSINDYILDKNMHQAQWELYGGFKFHILNYDPRTPPDYR